MKKLLAKIRKILHDRRTRQMLTRIVSVTAAIVVFITTYALVLPAITMESEANCGIEAHQHDESCYEDKLICGEIESPGHHHSEACYEVSKALVCEEQEHQHDDSCFDESGNLTCDQPEHTHDDTCYKESRELTCDIPESDGHQHSSACYERVLTCGKEIHTHSTACYDHASDSATSAPADFAAVATTELGSSGATVSASTEIETESGESDAASSETSDAWTMEKNAEGGASSSAATNASATATTTAGSSSTAAAAANTATASTGNTAFDPAAAEDTYIPQLEPVIFEQLLTKDTGIYYYHAEEGQEAPESSADIADWKRVNDDTELTPADLLRVYLRYTIPAGTLNATNDIARYRLPSNLHLTDQQMETINTTVNGVANQYVSLDTLEITDTEKYNTYLGIEATEGTRTPSDDIDKYFKNHPDLEGQEYINAVVRAENVFDDTTGEYAGQDLVFTFSPYTVQKNQHEYDADGQPTKAGQKVDGWLCFDLHMNQIDWSEPVVSATDDSAESTAKILFAAKDTSLDISEISTSLRLVELNTIESEKGDIQEGQSQSVDKSVDSDESKTTDHDTTEDSTSEEETSESDSADETTATADDKLESAVDVNAETYPAVSFEDTITVQAGTLSTDSASAAQNTPAETAITVSVIAEKETFPLGTTMQLGTVEDMDTVASAVEGAVEGQTRGFHAVDISFHNTDGEEIEPLKPIKVSMTSEAIKQAVEDSSTVPVVVHVENPADSEKTVGSSVSANHTDSKDTAILPENSTDADGKSADIDVNSDYVAAENENAPVATIVEASETSDTASSNGSKETADTISFDAGSFSVYAIVYTVDFHYEVDGKTYEFSIPGGGYVSLEHLAEVLGLAKKGESTVDSGENTDSAAYEETLSINNIEVSEATKNFVADVESVEFSNPELVWVGKIEEKTTVGALKEANKLDVQHSAELTEEHIKEINRRTVDAGDWALISILPFSSEESLTVTMKNGDSFAVKITDAAIAKENLVTDAGYIIYTQVGDKYYVLKTDGTTAEYSSTVEMDHLGNEYKWKFTYVYTENGIERYNIRPYNDKSVSLSLNYPGNTLVENGPNNITIVPVDNDNIGAGYIFGGFHNTMLRLNGSQVFEGTANESTPVFIYQLEDLHDFEFSVITNDSSMGKVSGIDKTGTQQNDAAIYTAVTKNYSDVSVDKANRDSITAVPDSTIQGANNTGSKYVFDHWELNGKPLYKNAQGKITTEVTYKPGTGNTQNPILNYWGETISKEALIIPYNESTLRAIFKESSTYQAKDDDKQGTQFGSMDAWLSSLIENNSPINEAATKKTAEVYDYENRVYRVDLKTQSNLRTINGNLDLGFVLDVSGSMKFPSKLEPANKPSEGERVNIWQINDAYSTHWDHGYYDRWGNWVHDDYNGNWTEIVDEYYWQHWGLDVDTPYYIIAEYDTRATVFRIHYNKTAQKWYRVDSSYENGDTKNDKEINSDVKFGNDENYKNLTYLLYTDGDYPNQRLTYEQQSMNNTINALKELVTAVSVVKDTGVSTDPKNPDARIAWNTFMGEVNNWDPKFKSVIATEDGAKINITYAYKGGTSTDLALGGKNKTADNSNYGAEKGAYNFKWEDTDSRYVVVITDGAPQYGDERHAPSGQTLKQNTDQLVGYVKDNISTLKTDKKVKVITVGLSMDDVEQGRKMLYDIADTVNGERMFYSAESGDQLEDILLHIIDTIMVNATVVGNVTDTIGEAFYPVDLATGTPLGDGDFIDLNGNKVGAAYTGFKGKITKDGSTYKVEWPNQDIPNTGWHGTVYVKAKEDFLGGNAVVTNNDSLGIANVTASSYKIPGSSTTYPLADQAYILDDSGNKVINTNYKLTKDMATPRVNVNELNFLQNNTEWTVYLGTEVDPLEQIKALYNNIEVEEVVRKGTAGTGTLPSELLPGKTKADFSYDFTESISDKREPKSGTTQTFLIKDLIESLVDKTGYTSTAWWDYAKNDIRWEKLIRMANLAEQDETTADDPDDPTDPAEPQAKNTGLIIPYKPYGIQDGGYIRILLTQETEGIEQDFTDNTIPAHDTTQTGDGVEKYSLAVFYTPDYSTVPVGQGGDPSTAKEFRTGGYGTAYQGHAAGTEESINDHEINVYAKGIDVLKLDPENQPLPGATFTLYRLAESGENGETLDEEYDLEGEYIVVGSGISDNNGIAEIKNGSKHVQLTKGKTYYLVETHVPDGYQRDTAHKVVTVQTKEDGIFTDLDNEPLDEKIYPFNWSQGVKILVDGESSQMVEAELTPDGYARLTEQVLFRARVLNDIKSTELKVTKNWKDKTGKSTAENGHTISFQVTRQVGETGSPEVVQLTDRNLPTVSGVSRNGNTITLTYNDGWPTADIVKLPFYLTGSTTQKYIYNIVETAHTPAEKDVSVSYNRVAIDDQHINITVENTDKEEPVNINVRKKWLDPEGGEIEDPEINEIEFALYRVHYVPCEHHWVVDEKEPTCTEAGHYNRECTKCHEKENINIDATGHAWGEWEIIDPATYNHTGTKQRVCQNDSSHVETESYTIEAHTDIPGEWITTKLADCEHDGEETQYCTICLKPLSTRVIPATGHNWIFDHTDAATCHAPGTVYYICQNDPSHTKTETIPKLEHQWGDTWVRTKEPTTKEEGEERRECLRGCGEYQTRPVPKLASTAKVSIYEDEQNNGNFYNIGTPDVRDVKVGSTVHIEFTGFPCYGYYNHPNITYRLNSTATYNNDMQCYELQGVETPMKFESELYDPILIWGRYSLDVVITEDTRIDICIPNSWYAPRLPIMSISVTEPEETSGHTMNTQALHMNRKAVRKASASTRLLAAPAENTIPEVLQGIQGTVIPATEADGRDNVYVYEVVGTYSVKQPGWTWSKDDLPRSDEKGRVYTYYVSETTSLSGYEVTYSGQTDGLQDEETAEIRNKALKGAIQITKLVTYNGDDVPSDKVDYVNKNYTFSITKEGETTPVKTATIAVINGESESILIGNLDEGNYVIRETNSSGLVLKDVDGGASHDDTAKTVTVHVTAGKTSQADLKTDAKASFTNNFTEYEIEILKVDTENTSTKLGGASFNLYKAEDVNTSTWTVIDGRTPVNKQPIISSSEEATKGKASLGELVTGTYYLFETKAPAGYNLLDTPITVIVSDGHVSLTQGTHEQTKDATREEIVDGKITFNVTNTAGAELPNTGGPGTNLPYLLGIMLIAFASTGFVMKSHRRNAA